MTVPALTLIMDKIQKPASWEAAVLAAFMSKHPSLTAITVAQSPVEFNQENNKSIAVITDNSI